jgi:integrase
MATYKRIDKHQNYYINPLTSLITYRRQQDGVMIVIHTGQETIKAAKRFVEDELKRRRGLSKGQIEREMKGISNPSIPRAWDECLGEREAFVEKSTYIKYGVAWRIGIMPFWGKLYATDVNLNTIKKYEQWYLKNHPTRVFFNTRKCLVMLFNYMAKHGIIDKSLPVSDLDVQIRAKTKAKKVGRVYTNKEIKAILEHSDERTRLGVLIGRFMGMRKMEILTLTWRLLHLEGKSPYAEVWSMKNKDWRNVPIPDQVMSELRAWQKKWGRRSEYVFFAPRDPSTHMSSQVFDKRWTAAKVAAGIKGATVQNAARVHDLRHTFASHTARDGWPTALASYCLDMSIHEYERTYVHVDNADVFKLMKRSFENYEL